MSSEPPKDVPVSAAELPLTIISFGWCYRGGGLKAASSSEAPTMFCCSLGRDLVCTTHGPGSLGRPWFVCFELQNTAVKAGEGGAAASIRVPSAAALPVLHHHHTGLALHQPRSSHNSLTEGEYCHTNPKSSQTHSWWSLVPRRNFTLQNKCEAVYQGS